jgi:hypothetical protein
VGAVVHCRRQSPRQQRADRGQRHDRYNSTNIDAAQVQKYKY